MPKTRKPAGTAVNPRNGRRAELEVDAGGALAWFELPPRRPAWLLATRGAWLAFRDDPVWQLYTPGDKTILLRWVDALDRAERAFRRADRKPVLEGGNRQLTEHPSYQTAAKMVAVAEKCEQQLGVGPLNRVRLGLTVTTARRSLLELNAAFAEGGEADEPDPRLG